MFDRKWINKLGEMSVRVRAGVRLGYVGRYRIWEGVDIRRKHDLRYVSYMVDRAEAGA